MSSRALLPARRGPVTTLHPEPQGEGISPQSAIEGVAKAIRSLPVTALRGSASPIDVQTMVQTAANSLSPAIGMTPPEIEQALMDQGLGYTMALAPGRPINPFFGYNRRPRGWNYTVGRNISTKPRQYRIPFETLRKIHESYDIAQICARHIIDDLRSMPLKFNPVEGINEDISEEVRLAKNFWLRPDGENDWPTWLGMWMQDILRFDAGVLYLRKDEGGRLIGVEVVEAATIAPLVDYFGKRPQAPAPAFLQFVAGLPWDWITKDDCIYTRFNPVREDVYGISPLEMVMLNANIDMRFQWHFLKYFTEGTVPEGFMEAPPDQSSTDAIERWQEAWEAWLMGDQGQKHKIRWVPSGSNYKAAKDIKFDPTFPTYLLRRTVAAHGLVPHDLGFLEDVNRSTGDTQMDVQFRISTAPKSIQIEHVVNYITQEILKLRVKISFDTGREKEDRLMEAQSHQLYVWMGAESPDEVRRDVLGLEVNPEEMTPRFIMSERLGILPLRYVQSVAGETDAATGSPMPGTVIATEFQLPGTKEPDPPIPGGPIDQGQTMHTAPGDDMTQPDDDTAPAYDAPGSGRRYEVAKQSQQLVAAGLAVIAADTQRVLMLQRALDPEDPAPGCWEFPGGCIEEGETPLVAATREWQEEVGAKLPAGFVPSTWTSPNGLYQGFVVVIPSESSVQINAGNDRLIPNPDDPDGDNSETVCWYPVEEASKLPGLRPEVRFTPWQLLKDVAGQIEKALTEGITAGTGIEGADLKGLEDEDHTDDSPPFAAPMGNAIPDADFLEKSSELKKTIRDWRSHARSAIRRGQPIRQFKDPVIPDLLRDHIWSQLSKATTRDEVERAFRWEEG